MADDNREEIEAEGPGGIKIKARGTDIIAVIVLVTGIVGVLLLYQHMQEAKADMTQLVVAQKEGNNHLAAVLKEMNTTNRELVSVQRVTNCLISRGQEERRSALAECERIAR